MSSPFVFSGFLDLNSDFLGVSVPPVVEDFRLRRRPRPVTDSSVSPVSSVVKPLSAFSSAICGPYFAATFFLPFPFMFLSLSSRSNTAATIIGNPTVASTNTSPNLPPSDGGTNLPHDIASLYGLPDNPPQYTGSGQILTP